MNGVEIVKELELGRAIANARRQAGLTQQELCARASLSYSTLAKIERGAIKTPSVFTVAAIAEATGTTVEALAGIVPSTAPLAPQKAYKTAKNGVKFVYFDVNGVLVRFFQRAFTALASDVGVSPDSVEAIFWRHNDAVNKGQMSLDEFNAVLAKHLGVNSVAWQDYYLNNIDPITEMQACVAWVSEHYRIGLMSNIMPGLLKQMIQRGLLPQVPYDVIIDSSEVKTIKPENLVYEIAAQRAGVLPQEILLIDDDRNNLTAAERLGWHVLWFDDYQPSESEVRIRQALTFTD